MEPQNALDTDAVAAMKSGSVVAHMMMTEKGKSAKTICFLCPEKLNSCTAAVTGKAGQLTKRTGCCKLVFSGSKNFIEKLQKVI